jgi:hypothetical protein
VPWELLPASGTPAETDWKFLLAAASTERRYTWCVVEAAKNRRVSRLAKDIRYILEKHPTMFRMFDMSSWTTGLNTNAQWQANPEYWGAANKRHGSQYWTDLEYARKLLEQESFFEYTGAVEIERS